METVTVSSMKVITDHDLGIGGLESIALDYSLIFHVNEQSCSDTTSQLRIM